MTIICEYDVTDDPALREAAYGSASEADVLRVERELAEEDAGYLLSVGETWSFAAEALPGDTGSPPAG